MKQKVVQFNESHKWCGSFGFINEIKGERIMVGVPIPQQGTAYIFVMENENAIEYIGKAIFIVKESEAN